MASVLPTAVAAPGTPTTGAALAPSYPTGWKVRPFALSDVTLDKGSIYERAQVNMLELARRYPLASWVAQSVPGSSGSTPGVVRASTCSTTQRAPRRLPAVGR